MKNFTVLLSVYNKENPEYLRKALDSIWISQTRKPNEIVIVKDGPLTNELNSVLSDFAKNAPVKFVHNENNLGLGASLNRGINLCSNNLIARMDTDDISHNDRFEKQLRIFEDNDNIDILGSWAIEIDKEGNYRSLRKVPTSNNTISKYIWTCPILHPTIMFKRDSLYKVGLYKKTLKRGEDYELWFRCVKTGLVFANIPEPLLKYRLTDDGFYKNNFKIIWQQVKIGWHGCKIIGASPIAYIGSAFPLVKCLVPKKIRMMSIQLFKRINPRERK